MKTAIVFLADGFEECEGLLVVDLLRRAGVRVITASVTGRREILSSHQVPVTADALATPLEGTNVLKIAAGSLTPTDTTCCDGLAISFATGSKLVLDASATGDLKTYGLYDVKWDAPITVEGGAPLPVEFDLPDGFNKTVASSFGICTVSPTAAASLDVDDFDIARVKGMKSTVRKVENRDGEDNVVSVTFACDLEPVGLILICR